MMVVEAHNVVKRFGAREAVAGIDLSVPPGVCFGLLGPNGAGKTTTLRMVYGVIRPTSGTVHVFGIDVAKHPRAVRSRLGVTLQQNVLIEALSPVENLRVFGRYHLLERSVLERRVEELLDFLELRSHAHVPVKHLSGGFQRRLAIALSLVNDPELLILDEPTTGLDPAVRLALWARVRALRAAGKTVLLTTHYMDEAQRLCDRVAIVSQGKVLSEGAPEALIATHLAREALECECEEREVPVLLDGLPVAQVLRTGDRLTVYADDVSAIADVIRARDGGERRTLVLRPTNLEDVFLALTGSTLEGEA
jgi:lipooligosaccharide transport system ATP-binding protein